VQGIAARVGQLVVPAAAARQELRLGKTLPGEPPGGHPDIRLGVPPLHLRHLRRGTLVIVRRRRIAGPLHKAALPAESTTTSTWTTTRGYHIPGQIANAAPATHHALGAPGQRIVQAELVLVVLEGRVVEQAIGRRLLIRVSSAVGIGIRVLTRVGTRAGTMDGRQARGALGARVSGRWRGGGVFVGALLLLALLLGEQRTLLLLLVTHGLLHQVVVVPAGTAPRLPVRSARGARGFVGAVASAVAGSIEWRRVMGVTIKELKLCTSKIYL